MRKTIVGLMATFMIGATAMAQSQATDNTERIQKRTEYVAKKYGLDDSQANLDVAAQMGFKAYWAQPYKDYTAIFDLH